MKTIRLFVALSTMLAAVAIIENAVDAVGPQPSVRGTAKSGSTSLTVMVTQNQDGSSDGRAIFRDAEANSRIEIQIDCMSINPATCPDCNPDSNSAALTGLVTSSNHPFFPAELVVGFVVEDNGQGKNSLPDRFTAISGRKEPCWPIHSPLLESERGIIRVETGQ